MQLPISPHRVRRDRNCQAVEYCIRYTHCKPPSTLLSQPVQEKGPVAVTGRSVGLKWIRRVDATIMWSAPKNEKHNAGEPQMFIDFNDYIWKIVTEISLIS